MGFEVEVKFRGVDHAELARRMADRGSPPGPAVDHVDTYFAHPSRDFARTGEAIRIRRIGRENRVTYKGPKLGGPAKTREEIEVGFAEGPEALDQVARIFERLGFAPVAEVRKRRTSYHLESGGRPIAVELDEAEGLGTFAEVEALAGSEPDLAEARRIVLAVAAELGLADVEPRSYLRMVLEARAAGGSPRNPAGQT